MSGNESRVKGCKDVLKHSNDNTIVLLCVPTEAGLVKAIGEGSFDGDSLHYYKKVDDKSLEGLHGLQSVPIWRFRVPKDELLAPNIVAMNRGNCDLMKIIHLIHFIRICYFLCWKGSW
jgi:hypothetical protein